MTQSDSTDFDAVIVGAGFAGMYMLYRLRQLGMRCIVLEMGDDVGGTWYWNRYPGARCDAESLAYSFSFSPELEQQWQWSERYATQPEILGYARHVSEHFDLRRDIHFNERVNGVVWQDRRWQVTTESGLAVSGQFCVLATGCLSVPTLPAIPGVDNFSGPRYQASLWPHEGVDFAGQHVGIIGTGSSAIQAIPIVAEQAKHLTVFQRTPNYSVPAANKVLDEDWVERFKANYRGHRHLHKHGLSSGFGDLEIQPKERVPAAESAEHFSQAEVDVILEPYWQRGGASFLGAFADTLMNESTNQKVAEFVRGKIRQIVKDPGVAETLCPTNHPIGTKRICVDTDYYATYNRDNVTLVDVSESPIDEITATGLRIGGKTYEFDTLVLATGFDAMTGALFNLNVVGEGGQTLRAKWAEGPRSYLGLSLNGFPNLFTITGPGSPSVLSNMLVSIEQHVDWLVACLRFMRDAGHERIEAESAAESGWVDHVNEVAHATLFPQAGSWYMGANVAGKPRVFMPYAAGVGAYREVCQDVADNGYRGFQFS